MWGKRRGIFCKFGANLARSVPHLDHFSTKCAPSGPIFHEICPSLAIFYVKHALFKAKLARPGLICWYNESSQGAFSGAPWSEGGGHGPLGPPPRSAPAVRGSTLLAPFIISLPCALLLSIFCALLLFDIFSCSFFIFLCSLHLFEFSSCFMLLYRIFLCSSTLFIIFGVPYSKIISCLLPAPLPILWLAPCSFVSNWASSLLRDYP